MLTPYNRAELNFDIIQEIGGEGKNSQTFLIRDLQLDAEIVLKKIKRTDFECPEEYFNEAQLLYASAHPYVVQILYACHDVDYICVAMPYYEKGSLKSLMNTCHLTVREILRFSLQILSGLTRIHSKGLIHFDIKPDNILLSKRNEALLSDFGLAKNMDNLGNAIQDKHYTSMHPPEALKINIFNLTFDIYQFGLTLYRMCNGDKNFYEQLNKYAPFDEQHKLRFIEDIENDKFPEKNKFLPHIPTKLRRVVAKCLKIEPEQRYQSALDVANDLADIDGNCLDWRYLDEGKWEKIIDEKRYELILDTENSSILTKTIGTGKPKKVSAASLSNISVRQLTKIFAEY